MAHDMTRSPSHVCLGDIWKTILIRFYIIIWMSDLDDTTRFFKLFEIYDEELDAIVALFDRFETVTYQDFAHYISETVEDFNPDIKNLRMGCLALDYILTVLGENMKKETGKQMLDMLNYKIWVTPHNGGARYAAENHVVMEIEKNILPIILSDSLFRDLSTLKALILEKTTI